METPDRSAATVTFTEHPKGRHRTHMRNTIFGWVEERDHEGFIHVTLEDGFHYLMEGDEWMLEGDRPYLVGLACEARERYLQETERPWSHSVLPSMSRRTSLAPRT